jgi:gamma-glutamyltranspeptidase
MFSGISRAEPLGRVRLVERPLISGQETATELRPIFKVEDRVPQAVVDALRTKGYQVQSVKNDGGLVSSIMLDPRTGFRLGGADPRESGYAIGW